MVPLFCHLPPTVPMSFKKPQTMPTITKARVVGDDALCLGDFIKVFPPMLVNAVVLIG